ncbi:MAG: hypothetical protein ACRDD8_11450 [Bacteroidales bacterium]
MVAWERICGIRHGYYHRWEAEVGAAPTSMQKMRWIKTVDGYEVSEETLNKRPLFEIEQKFALYHGKIYYYAKRMTASGQYVACGSSCNKSYLKRKLEKI